MTTTQKINYLRLKSVEAFKKRLIEDAIKEKINPGFIVIKGRKYWTL